MRIRDMLDNELVILKITEFLNIQEIQNLIIALNINVKTNVYFMRECLSLLNIKFDNRHEINNSEIKIENIMNSNVSSKIDENNVSSNLSNLFLQTCNYTDTETNSDASTYGSITFDTLNKHDNSFIHNYDSQNDEIYNAIPNFDDNNNYEDNNYFETLDTINSQNTNLNTVYKKKKKKKKNIKNKLPFENIFEKDLDQSPKNSYENDFCKNFFSTINIDHTKVSKKQMKYLLEIKNCLKKSEKKTIDNDNKSENVFNHIWMYMHMRNPIIDIDKEYKNSFFKININNFCHRNNKIQFDIFGIYKYDDKYYSFIDIPWIDIYFQLCLNAICSFCNIKVDHKSNCIFSEKISLEMSNQILIKYLNSKNQSISINQTPSASTIKNSPENNKTTFKNSDIIKDEDNYDVIIPFDETYEEFTTPKKRKLDYFNDFDNIDSQGKGESLNDELEMESNNNEFFFIKKTHIFCDECYKLVSYKSEVKPVFELIIEDYNLLLQLKLVEKVVDFPRELFCICNYFFLKDRYIEFFKKLSITIQELRKRLIRKLINNFIFTFTLNFYQYIIKPLLLCDEKKLLNQENFFLVGFYVKYKNLLKLFNSPRITYVYYSFNIIFQKIKTLQRYYKNNYFMKISRSLHFDVITFLEKYKKSQARVLYKNISKYVYDHLNYDILSKNNYSEIYEYFFQCLRTYKFM
ncbi:conserved Plasmodium protein, unknown function [Plasmodium chabaudi adami]|uniref:Uncharacterized protein n=1 Tax=Plasmodium chabaudi adami TaxID=5826 RepID=A0A1D3RZ95_PLACE|nr:conserved Plasmodium protein, unknown function [Plasmodium chabaudi adami]